LTGVVWTKVEHTSEGTRLVLSDEHGPDVDLVMKAISADEVGRALFGGGGASSVDATTVDGEHALIWIAGGEIRIESEGEAAKSFLLAEQAVEVGEQLLARPVQYEVECPSCSRRSRSTTTVAPSSEVAQARARQSTWTCPFCATTLPMASLVEDADDVWRVSEAV
jgi:hypothetical protein